MQWQRMQKEKDTKTASFWVFAQTTHVVVSKPTLIYGMAPGLSSCILFSTKLLNGFRRPEGLKIDFSLFKASGLYNSLLLLHDPNVNCFQTFNCIYRLFFIFEVYYRIVSLVLSRAAISGISVLAVPLDLFCCTCYSVMFLSQ